MRARIVLRLAGRVLAVLLVREVGCALHPVQQLYLLMQGGENLVRVAGVQRARETLVCRPLRQLPGIEAGEQFADRVAQRVR